MNRIYSNIIIPRIRRNININNNNIYNNNLRILKNNLSLAPSASSCNGKVVVVTSGKGGVGKTTTAASFAYGLAELGNIISLINAT